MKRMPNLEFVSAGYLQETNRRWLHPLGLALTLDANGDFYIADYRDTEIYFGHFTLVDADRYLRVEQVLCHRIPARKRALGYVVQPMLERDPVEPASASVAEEARPT